MEATVTGDRCWYHIIDSMGEPMGLQGLSGRVRHVYQSPLQLKLGLLSIPSGPSWGRFPDLWHSALLDWTGTPSQHGFSAPTGMRILVTLLLDTLPMLGNVLLLCFFVFFIFGIVGVQLWAGLLRNRCFLPENFSL